jgi:hypothetical protein
VENFISDRPTTIATIETIKGRDARVGTSLSPVSPASGSRSMHVNDLLKQLLASYACATCGIDTRH